MIRFIISVSICLLSGLFLLSCSSDDQPCGLEVSAGTIEGKVSCGGLDLNGVITAVPIVDGQAVEAILETQPDANGLYSLDLPAGRYVVKLQAGYSRYVYDYTGSLPGYGQIPADTLLVDETHSHQGVDFELGGLTLQLELSGNLDGEIGEVVLHRYEAQSSGGWTTFVSQGSAVITDGRLNVEIAGILPGDYQVEIVLGRRHYACYCPYDGEHFWMPGTREQSASPWYSVEPDSVVALETSIALEPARLEGRIIGAWLELGLSTEPELSIVSPDSVPIMGRRRVESDGSFGLDIHLPGPVKLLVTQSTLNYGFGSNGSISQWIGGPGFEEATVFDLQLGETISGIELVQSGVRVAVNAPDHRFGESTFEFYDPATLALVASVPITSTFDGPFGIANLWPGDFYLRVDHNPSLFDTAAWRPQWFDRTTSIEEAQLVTIINEDDILTLDLTLELGGMIDGTLNLGPDVEDFYYIVITPADEFSSLYFTYVFDGHSGYELRGLADGGYRVGLFPAGQGWQWPSPPPEGTAWYPGTEDWNSAEVLQILDAGSVGEVDFQ